VHSDRKFLSDYFPRSYTPLNLENSKYLLLSLWALLLKLLNRISWNLVVIMDIICKLVIYLLSHFIHIWYRDWPWSEHAHIIPISRMVDFCESYSPFHVPFRAAAINYLVVSEKKRSQTLSVVYISNFLSSKGHNS
jgi:amino acid transporter